MQVKPIKPTLKAPGTKRWKLKYDELLSSFAFKFNLRRYSMAFLDGSLGAGTALMHEAYADDAANTGIAVCNLTEFQERVVRADAAGLQAGAYTRSQFSST